MRERKNIHLIELATLSKYLYNKYREDYKLRKTTLLLSLILLYIYNHKSVTTTIMYHELPFNSTNFVYNLAQLIDLGFLSKTSGANRVSTYTLTAYGKRIVEDGLKAKINTNYIAKQFQVSCKSPATRTK